MFIGEYQHGIDDKGRLFMPARFRETLGERFIVTKGLDQCLFAFPLAEWQRLEERLKGLSFTRSEARAFTRMFFAGAAEVEMDRQGRILIPPHLREYGGLEKEAVVLGLSSRVEIWAREVWERYKEQADETYESVAEKIVDFGL